jgi:GNAT superfamily N-acetyltransferase
MRTEILTGDALSGALDDLAHLRIRVFRDWPYLYDGTADYERTYLKAYERALQAIVIGIYDQDELVGASTGAPLAEHADDFFQAFYGTDIKIDKMFYCGESLLLPRYRGQGIGHQFFDQREAFARDLGFEQICFAAVVRPADHPLRPHDYQPLDGFWHKRGYDRLHGAVAHFSWKDIDQAAETEKPLQMWGRDL